MVIGLWVHLNSLGELHEVMELLWGSTSPDGMEGRSEGRVVKAEEPPSPSSGAVPAGDLVSTFMVCSEWSSSAAPAQLREWSGGAPFLDTLTRSNSSLTFAAFGYT